MKRKEKKDVKKVENKRTNKNKKINNLNNKINSSSQNNIDHSNIDHDNVDLNFEENLAIAKTFTSLKCPDEAIVSYKNALRLNPKEKTLYREIAELYYDKKDYKNALLYYNKYKKIVKKNNNTSLELDQSLWFKLAIIYEELNKLTESIMYFKKCLEMNQNNEENYIMICNALVNCLSKKEDIDGAIDILKKASKLYPNISKLYYNIGILLLAKDEKKKALKYMKKALQKESDNKDYLEEYNQIKKI